jgi:surface protein
MNFTEVEIKNSNIKSLVKLYITDKNKLPYDLKNIPIGKWDVSKVTDMHNLFSGYKNFNQPLNDWNVSNVENMASMFAGCSSFNQPLNDWKVSKVEDMSSMFAGCSSFNQPLNKWNVSGVDSFFGMSSMFAGCSSFNQRLNKWNVSQVKNMSSMFAGCSSFNQPLNKWNVSGVVRPSGMDSMFDGCSSFNQPLNKWKVSQVKSMSKMFYGCSSFNQPLNNWKVSKVTDMSKMFYGCSSFNQPLNDWIVSNVKSMDSMFSGCSNFNQSLNDWNVLEVKSMSSMFAGCSDFNKPLNDWKVSSVTDMSKMFVGCSDFNQPLNDWNVSNVKSMDSMFSGCSDFNKPLNNWVISNVTDMTKMFSGCSKFNQPLRDWRISEITITTNIFENCNISQGNKPRLPDEFVVDPNHAHVEFKKINITKLNNFLKTKLGKKINTNVESYPSFIRDSFNTLIDNINSNEKQKQKDDLNKIMNNRLNNINYETEFNKAVLDSTIYILKYVSQQPNDFKKMYVEVFLFDNLNAYDEGDTLSCAKGVIERIITSSTAACKTDVDNDDYNELAKIVGEDPRIVIPEQIKDWYRLHKQDTDGKFPEELTIDVKEADDAYEDAVKAAANADKSTKAAAEAAVKKAKDAAAKVRILTGNRRNDLKNYLLNIHPEQGELIEEMIKNYADIIGYTDDVFTYGGGKRKKQIVNKITLRTLNRKKTNKNKKMKTIKINRRIRKTNKNKKTKTKTIKINRRIRKTKKQK